MHTLVACHCPSARWPFLCGCHTISWKVVLRSIGRKASVNLRVPRKLNLTCMSQRTLNNDQMAGPALLRAQGVQTLHIQGVLHSTFTNGTGRN